MGGLNVTPLVKDVGTWGCLQQAQTVHGLDGAPQMILHCVSFGKKPQGCRTAPSATGTDGACIQEGLWRLKPFWDDPVAGLPVLTPAPAVPWSKGSSGHPALCKSHSSG